MRTRENGEYPARPPEHTFASVEDTCVDLTERSHDQQDLAFASEAIAPATAAQSSDLSLRLGRLKQLKHEQDLEIPLPPQSVIEFTQAAREPKACVQTLSRIVASDQGMTIELLKTVNSSIVGLRERVDSVARAISLLGVSHCTSIFLTKSLERAVRNTDSDLLPYGTMRRESADRARFAQQVAIRLGSDPLLSFISTTVQDILLPTLTHRHRNAYSKYVKSQTFNDIDQFERDTFGWTHGELAARTMESWRFPRSLVIRVLLHHMPPEELFLRDEEFFQALPNACAALLRDSLNQSPSGVPRLVELQRFHPSMKLLSIAADADKVADDSGSCDRSGLPLVNQIHFAMLDQVERSRRESIMPGRQFGNYVLEKKVTESAMGAIYKAKHIMLRRDVAIKFLRADRTTRSSIRQFEREVQLTSTLRHPNTISIFDFGRTGNDLFYYAMEYIDGPTLSELVAKCGPVPDGRAHQILLQVLGALSEAHAHRLVHRDIKPQNIMVTEVPGLGERSVLLDFGLVSRSDSLAIGTTEICGTPLYISPEAASCDAVIDERSDLYSFGAVAYFVLTGLPVFEGTLTEVLMKHINEIPRLPSLRTASPIAPEIEAVIMRCLRKKPNDRPASAKEALDLLLACQPLTSWSTADSRDWWRSFRAPPAAVVDSGPKEQPRLLEDETFVGSRPHQNP